MNCLLSLGTASDSSDEIDFLPCVVHTYRFSKRYMILCGLWSDREKPDMKIFLGHLTETLNHLYSEGQMRTIQAAVFVGETAVWHLLE